MKSPLWYNKLSAGKKLTIQFFAWSIFWFCFEYAWSFIPGDEERYTIPKMITRSVSMTVIILFLSKHDLIKEAFQKNKRPKDDTK